MPREKKMRSYAHFLNTERVSGQYIRTWFMPIVTWTQKCSTYKSAKMTLVNNADFFLFLHRKEETSIWKRAIYFIMAKSHQVWLKQLFIAAMSVFTRIVNIHVKRKVPRNVRGPLKTDCFHTNKRKFTCYLPCKFPGLAYEHCAKATTWYVSVGFVSRKNALCEVSVENLWFYP